MHHFIRRAWFARCWLFVFSGGILTVLLGSGSAVWAQQAPIKVACIGDSITFGAGAKDRTTDAYPVVLQKLLGDGYQVKNFGVSGATMGRAGDKPYHKLQAYQDALAFKPDWAVVKLGTNDSKPQNWEDGPEADFAASAAALIDALREANPKVRIVVCLPVPAFPSNFRIRDEVIRDGVIPKLRDTAEAKKAEVLDLYTPFLPHKEHFPDKVHPNTDGYRLLAETIHKGLTP